MILFADLLFDDLGRKRYGDLGYLVFCLSYRILLFELDLRLGSLDYPIRLFVSILDNLLLGNSGFSCCTADKLSCLAFGT